MGLPVGFKNVHYYRITGRYTFSGDLFVARGAIYYFPEVDLAEQRERSFEYVPHQLGLVALAVVYVMQKLKPYSPRHDLWEEGMTDERFQKKANAYIEAMKEIRRERSFSELPVPLRAGADEISDLKLSATGKLSFLAQSDSHDFNVGLSKKRRLREALWEGGLGRV